MVEVYRRISGSEGVEAFLRFEGEAEREREREKRREVSEHLLFDNFFHVFLLSYISRKKIQAS